MIDGKVAKSMMVDADATYNFYSKNKTIILSLKLRRDMGQMKVINSKSLPALGLAK